MSTPVLFVIFFIPIALAVIFWATRTRGNTTGPHVDTTMTAVGVVTEAIEELADTVKHAVKAEPEVKGGGGMDGSGAPAAALKQTPATAGKAAAPTEAASKSTKAPAPKASKAAARKSAKAPATEPVKVAAPKPSLASKPAKAVAPKPAAAKPAKPAKADASAPDELRQLKGVGPKLVTLLNELGVKRFDQIAAWGPAEIDTIDAQLGTFKGRIARDNWVEQAGFLAKGDIAGFEAKFGKLDSPGNS
jgi:predicted flap endonuclease-1-like 5' DNA nuclease